MEIKQLVIDLKKNSSYQNWGSSHQNSFLSHLFTKIDQDLNKTDEWDIGYFCPDENKVTIFSKDETGNFFLKNTDDVFKREMDKVIPLDISKVSLNLLQAKEKTMFYLNDKFPTYLNLLGNGFIILQTLNDQINWNVSIITKKMSMINIKFSAVDGTFISKDEVNFMQQK